MVTLWFSVLAFMLSTYVVLDGRNFGAGVLQLFVAKNVAERRQVIAAIGPLWLWHEVWLVGSGGVLFAAFPRLLASAFAGYYLALFLVLWCTLLRGIAIEVGGHIDDRLWRAFWDAVLFVASGLLAILFGAALGNLLRGVPLKPDGSFHMAFFTDFRPWGHVGLLDWYTVPVAFFALLVLAAHGATYLTMRTLGDSPVHQRSARLARRLWLAVVPGFLVVSVLTYCVRPELFVASMRPLTVIGALVTAGAAGTLGEALLRRRERRAFVASTVFVQAILLTGATALYPTMLSSTLDPASSLTADSVAAPHESLVIASFWWPVAAVLAFAYFFFVLRYYGGKVSTERDDQALY